MSGVPNSSTGLFWSTRGHVACAEHADQILDSRWAAEGWAPMPASSQGFRGVRYQCQYCSPQHIAMVHPSASVRAFSSQR